MTRRIVADPQTHALPIGCVWCDQPTHAFREQMFQGQARVCPCGATVLFAPPHDFDEAAEELLGHLGLEGTVTEPLQPVGTTGLITMRAYDGAVSRRQLAAILEHHGHETRPEDILAEFTGWSGQTHQVTEWGLWWRPR